MKENAWRWVLVAGGVVGVAHFLVPSGLPQDVAQLVLRLGCLAGLVVGLRWHRPADMGPWTLLVALVALFTVCGVIEASIWRPEGGPVRLLVDIMLLGAYLMVGAMATSFARRLLPGDNDEGASDSAILTAAILLLLWGTVFDPDALPADATLINRILYVAFPLAPAWVTATTVRLMFVAHWLPGVRFGAFGGLAMLAGNIGRAFQVQAGTFVPGSWVEGTWMIAFLSAAMMALHPTMRQLTEPVPVVRSRLSRGRTTVLGVALLAGPFGLLRATGASLSDVALPVAASVALSGLIVWRLARLVGQRERARVALSRRAGQQEALARVSERALAGVPVAELALEVADLVRDLAAVGGCRVVLGEPPEGEVEAAWMRYGIGGEERLGALEVLVPEEGMREEDRAFLMSLPGVLAVALQRQQAEEEMRHRLMHDALTGLPNRVLLTDRLALGLARRERRGQQVAVLFLDLDRFKEVNDTLGHSAGDELLLALADRLQAVIRPEDTLGRLGGDEFVVVCEGLGEDGAAQLAERIQLAVSQPFELAAGVASVGVSVGIALGDEHTAPERLLGDADAAMYRAKELGRGRNELFGEALRRRLDQQRGNLNPAGS